MPFTASTQLQTEFGDFKSSFFKDNSGDSCLVLQTAINHHIPVVRLHSACLFGEAFHSLLCDCQRQLNIALELIAKRGGAFIYLFQEGRGSGLEAKIRAMELERVSNVTSEEAYRRLSYVPDSRKYDIAVNVMKEMNLPHQIALFTSNAEKIAAIKAGGFDIVELLNAKGQVTKSNQKRHHGLGKF